MTVWVEMKKHFEVRSLEWFNGIYLLLWSAYVLLHPGMMTSSSFNVFNGLLDIARQEVWGLIGFTSAMVRLGALWINGRWSLTPLFRVATSFMSVFVWFWVSVGLYRSGVEQTGLVLYPGLMCSDMFSAFRAASDAYEAEAMRRLEAKLESSNVRRIASRRG